MTKVAREEEETVNCPNCSRIFDKSKQCKSIEEYRSLTTEIAIRFVEDRM